MGGSEAILGVHTLQADGYGLEAYFWGGGTPQKSSEARHKLFACGQCIGRINGYSCVVEPSFEA